MIVRTRGCLTVSKIGPSDIGAEEIVLQGASRRGVLILRQESRAIRDRVQVAPLEQVSAERSNVGYIQDRLQTYVSLHSERIIVDIRHVAFRPVHLHPGRKQHTA